MLALAQRIELRAAQTSEPQPPQGLMYWMDPATAPFIPVPEIDADPNGDTTFGIMPVKLIVDDKAQVSRLFAPDLTYNAYFGVGVRGRAYAFLSDDTQWSMIAGIKQRVESEFDFEYQTGRLRDSLFSFSASVVYDRSGTQRFYGIGNDTSSVAQTNYTLQQMYLQSIFGVNLNRTLQISYLLRVRSVDVQSGTLPNIPSMETVFGNVPGLGTTHESLNRVALICDTRDDTTVPTTGGEYVIYAGVAAGNGVLNDSLYSVAGLDLRRLWTIAPGDTIAAHAALRYMPGHRGVPFWSLSNVGGDESILGGAQPLRGYGSGRFYDRNSLSASLEYRRRVLTLSAGATAINVEVTPFLEIGEVFANSGNPTLERMHRVGGVGFRGIAAPFVVGYVDVGYGNEGAAVFTGINYPF